MKTFQQFNEDIVKRTQELRKRRQRQVQAHKDKVASYHLAQKQKLKSAEEREELKKEIKRELKADT